MKAKRSISELTRQGLYDLIWCTPAVRLAADFGISDVAIAKRCKKLNVPRPPRGYWAKIEAGQRPRKSPLPLEEEFERTARKPLDKEFSLPAKDEPLHPLAVDLLRAMNGAKPDTDRRVRLRVPALPEATVTQSLAERVAQAFHGILQGVEPLGIKFRKSQSSYDGGHFRKGNDRLYFQIEETLVEKSGDPGGSLRRPSWQSQAEKRVPSGWLTFSLKAERYGGGEAKQWTEGEKSPLAGVVILVVTEIRRHFVEAQRRREREAEEQEKRHKEWLEQQRKQKEEEAIQLEKEKKRKHTAAIARVSLERKDDLLKAAEWWRMHETLMAFIYTCERRWQNEGAGELSGGQQAWLEWARHHADSLSPFESGYPAPATDGDFDAVAIPFGGPYPAVRDFPQPPTMPRIPAPVVVQQSQGAPSYQPESKPYPFWLKYQR